MRNVWLVARREFVSRGRSGAYLISTLFMVIALFFATVGPSLLRDRTETRPLHVLLLDATGQVAAPLGQALAEAGRTPGAVPVTLEPSQGEETALMERARREGKVLLIVDGTYPNATRTRFLSSNTGDLDHSGAVLGPLESLVRVARVRQAGIDEAVAAQVLAPFQVEVAQLTAAGGQRDSSAVLGSFFLALGMVMMLYMVVLINGQFVFQGVLEEKVSRVMEVMAATVGPGQMLAGKVIGLGALGLIQFLAMMGAWAAGSAVTRDTAVSGASSLNLGTAALSLLFLVLGYVLSATLMAAAAATISRMEDQQTVLMPIVMLIALPVMLLTAVMNDTNSGFATVISLIPFFSQSMMVFRVLMGDVPLWQVLTALALMVATTVWATWAGGRVYRAAMLSYGGRPSLRQIWSYLRAG